MCLRASSEREPVAPGISMDDICTLIGAEVLDTVNLRDGRVMVIDDAGAIKNLPVNPEATGLYHAICIPGTTWLIRGDVVIVRDADYEEPDR